VKDALASRLGVVGLHAGGSAENFLFRQFRAWMDAHAVRRSCRPTPAENGPAPRPVCPAARLLLAEIQFFAQVLHQCTTRPIEWFPDLGCCLSRDEALVLTLIQASQTQDAYTEIAAACQLLGSGRIEALVRSSRSLALALDEHHLRLEAIEPITTLPSAQLGLGPRVLH